MKRRLLLTGAGGFLRSTLIYGPGDLRYLGRLLRLLRCSALVPLLGSGRNRFQFVHVDDVAIAVAVSLRERISGNHLLVGPESLTYRELIDRPLRHFGWKRRIVSLPLFLLYPLAHLLQQWPGAPLLTPSQLDNLAFDRNYSSLDHWNPFHHHPRSLDVGLPVEVED